MFSRTGCSPRHLQSGRSSESWDEMHEVFVARNGPEVGPVKFAKFGNGFQRRRLKPIEDPGMAVGVALLQRTYGMSGQHRKRWLAHQAERLRAKMKQEQNAAREEAAIMIQAIIRGRQQKLQFAIHKKRKMEAAVVIQKNLRKKLARGVGNPRRLPQWHEGAQLPLPDLEVAWELLTSKGGSFTTSCEVSHCFQVFSECMHLGHLLASSDVFKEWSTITDSRALQPWELSYVFAMALASDLSDRPTGEELRARLDEKCREFLMIGQDISREEFGVKGGTTFTLMYFKKLLIWLGNLMGVSEELLISHMVWVISGRFVILPEVGAELVAKALRREKQDGVRLLPQDLNQLFRNLKLIDQRKKVGIPPADMQSIISKTLRHMQFLFVDHGRHRIPLVEISDNQLARRRSIGPPALALVGWTHFGILWQEIYSAMPPGVYSSPLDMCLNVLKR
eukprot:TRINITY_DN9302_c0_g1_i1.p1 TRINITY_DN9302_c0_g1~~TRINITY_DN9302_c0_g1_i1.p1  ORF type:complete len:450 (-),score=66.72 TRINITY_DN9302_c0_g1_i1:108-1457(-)